MFSFREWNFFYNGDLGTLTIYKIVFNLFVSFFVTRIFRRWGHGDINYHTKLVFYLFVSFFVERIFRRWGHGDINYHTKLFFYLFVSFFVERIFRRWEHGDIDYLNCSLRKSFFSSEGLKKTDFLHPFYIGMNFTWTDCIETRLLRCILS